MRTLADQVPGGVPARLRVRVRVALAPLWESAGPIAAAPLSGAHRAWLAALAALAGGLCLVLYAAVAPGGMTKDSTFQLAQAQGRVPFNDWHPVGMSLVWRGLLALTGAIGSMAAAQIAVAGCCAVLLCWYLLVMTRSRALSLLGLLVLVLPHTANLLGTVWKDTQMALALTLAVVCLLLLRVRGSGPRLRWTLLGVIVLALLYAALVRKNAVLGIVPLVVLAAVLVLRLRRSGGVRRILAVSGAALALLGAAVAGIGGLLDAATGATKTGQVTQVMLDDLIFAVPAAAIEASPSAPPELERKLAAARAVCAEKGVIWDSYWDCYERGADGRGFTAIEHREEVTALWLEQIPRHLPEYAAYRLRTTGEFLFTSDLRFILTEEDPEHGVPVRFPALNQAFAAYVADGAVPAVPFLFRGWFWLLLGLVGCVVSLSRVRPSLSAAAVFLSGVLYLAGFVPTAPAADYRYIYWTALSVLLGGLVLLAEQVHLRLPGSAGER